MKYIVVRITKAFDYETRDTMCITDTEELAVKVKDWLKKNDKPPFPDNERSEFYIVPVPEVYSLDNFIEHYKEDIEI